MQTCYYEPCKYIKWEVSPCSLQGFKAHIFASGRPFQFNTVILCGVVEEFIKFNFFKEIKALAFCNIILH